MYIGKATSLRSRARSYFADDLINTRGPAIVDMITQADEISYRRTDSVLEALILEAALIKKHQPKYNIKERDDKSFNSVVITDEKYPRVLIIRDRALRENSAKKLGGAKVKIKKQFGPFPNGSQLRSAIKLIRKIFPFFDTAKPVDSMSEKDQARIRLNIQIGIYPDIFSEKVSATDYRRQIRQIELFFEGKKKQILRNLKSQMKTLARNQEYERAAQMRSTIFALQHINDVSLIKSDETQSPSNFGPSRTQKTRIEAFDVAHTSGKQTVGVMTVIEGGQPEKSEYRKFIIKNSIRNDDYSALSEILNRRKRHAEWKSANILVVDGGIGQLNIAKRLFGIDDKKSPSPKSPNNTPYIIAVVKDSKHKPKKILGDKKIVKKYRREILLANSEAHRFALAFHRRRRADAA